MKQIKLTLTYEEACLVRDAMKDMKCNLSSVGGVVKNIDNFTGKRKEMIQSCIDVKTVLESQIARY